MTNYRSNKSEVRQQAANYVARLYSGELSAQEETQIYHWCQTNPLHQQEFDAMLAIWDSSSQLYQTDTRPRYHKLSYWLSGIAASLVAVTLLSWLIFAPRNLEQSISPQVQPNHYQTAVGEISTVGLPDGSVVTLNTDSVIEIDFSGNQRKVWLRRGEVFFDVAKDPARVFSINTGQKTIRVIGTKFNVRKSDSSLKVSVSEGLVAIQNSQLPLSDNIDFDHAETLLPAGSVGAFSGTSEVVSQDIPEQVAKTQHWRQGVFRFENESLDNVINEFNRYRIKKIQLQTAQLGQLKISGVFRLKDGDSIITALETALPVQVQKTPEYILLMPKS
ncbi:FecR family protein [Neptunicella sp. SCSIO 80796]|uniref:FecR family protein n=1 Tax=Neptunicella plasticusilytica TaxID=3117012 RepID=UPI003A4E2E37